MSRALACPGCPDAVAVVLASERRDTRRPLLDTLFDYLASGPPAVREAAGAILAACAPWALDVRRGARILLAAAGESRDRAIFEAWLAGDGEVTFEKIGRRKGMSGASISRILEHAEPKVRKALPDAPTPWPWLVASLRKILGTLGTVEQIDAVFAGLGVGNSKSARSTQALALWLAGPYRPVPDHPGWLAVDAKGLTARTTRALAADGGVRRRVEIGAELGEAGVSAKHLDTWLAECGSVAVYDLVVSTAGPLADVLERILDAYGTPRHEQELLLDLDRARRPLPAGALAVAARSGRFARGDDGSIRLASWPADVGTEATKPAPKSASIALAPATSTTSRAAKRSQPKAAARKRPTPSQKQASATRPRSQPSATGAQTVGAERLWLWVRVDSDVLRGSEAPVPAALVECLGLAPMSRRTFSSRWGPVTLTHHGQLAFRGSLRAVAMAAGAVAGDSLRLGFSRSGDIEVAVQNPDNPQYPDNVEPIYEEAR